MNHGVTTRCCLQKNLSQDTGTTKSSGVRSEDPLKTFTKNNLSHKNKTGTLYFPLDPGWFLGILISWSISKIPHITGVFDFITQKP